MSTVQRLTKTRNLRGGKRENNGSNLFFNSVRPCVCGQHTRSNDQRGAVKPQDWTLWSTIAFYALIKAVVSLLQHALRANADLWIPSISLNVDARIHMKIHSQVWKASYRFLFTFTQLKLTVLQLKDTVKNLRMLPRLWRSTSKTPCCFTSEHYHPHMSK